MADHTKTVSNSINCFGHAPTEKWNAMTWGVDNWGEGTEDLPCDIGKTVSNSQPVTGATLHKDVANLLSFGEIASDYECVVEYLTDGSGYNYIFPGCVTDADERTSTEYSEPSGASTTYTSSTATTTTWS